MPTSTTNRRNAVAYDPSADPRMLPPTHPYPGSNSERQSVGDPGHCEDCAVHGHVAAHPDLGCGDVGCTRGHGTDDDPSDGTERVYRVRWSVPMDLVVEVRGKVDEETAYDRAVELAKERLEQVSVTSNHVAIHGDIDGMEADEVGRVR